MNNKEIELKYKVNKIARGYKNKLEFIQVYFDGEKKKSILKEEFKDLDLSTINTFRVRRIKEKEKESIVLTLKTKATGFTRNEYEKEISEDIYNILTKNNEVSKIVKNRYVYSFDGYKFELDKYLNLKSKLYTLEVEFKDEEDLINNKERIESIIKNKLGLESTDVTSDNRYKNSNLHKYF